MQDMKLLNIQNEVTSVRVSVCLFVFSIITLGIFVRNFHQDLIEKWFLRAVGIYLDLKF